MSALLLAYLAIFGALLVLIIKDRHRAGALTLSYFASMALIHVPGALTFVATPIGQEDTLEGLKFTVLGAGMYVAGVAAAQLFGDRRQRASIHDAPLDPEWLQTIGHKFLVIGCFVFFVAIPVIAEIPSLTSILSSLVGLLVVGTWLILSAAIIKRDRRRLLFTLALLPLLPFATLTAIGFVSFSTQWIVTILAFLFMMTRRKTLLIVLMPAVLYVSLSMFVAYMGERNAIRDVIWYEEADLRTRLDRISDIFVNFELLDVSDPKHAAALDARLNQNSLVGAAVASLDEHSATFAYGATVPWWALIPRVIWPDKPEIGGGRNVVSDFTGMVFPEGTSVGAGQVLEFYVNFGTGGVIAGFFIWGFMIMAIDRRIMRAMSNVDMRSLMRWSMVGLTLVNPGGNLLEIIIAAVGAFVATPMILFLDHKLRMLPVVGARMKGVVTVRPR